jgi:cytochrome c oxidase cbb3-type subunit 2
MKRIAVVGTAIIALIVVYSYSQGMMRHGPGMMGRGMMSNDLMRWFNGKEVAINLAQERPLENENNIAMGQRIYRQRCTACHGEKGDGNGTNSEHLITKPTDFTAGLYKFRTTPSGSIPTNEDIYTTISKGIRGTAMLPWFDLSNKEKWYVTFYLKTLSDRFKEEEAESAVTVPRADTDTIELVNKGRYIYEQTKCWECHGNEGRGDGTKTGNLKDDWGRPVRLKDFTREPLKRGANVGDIYLTVATGLDGTPMASYINNIPPDNMVALSFYIKSLTDKQQQRRRGMMAMSQDERIGMMTYHHGGAHGMMHGRMMGG